MKNVELIKLLRMMPAGSTVGEVNIDAPDGSRWVLRADGLIRYAHKPDREGEGPDARWLKRYERQRAEAKEARAEEHARWEAERPEREAREADRRAKFEERQANLEEAARRALEISEREGRSLESVCEEIATLTSLKPEHKKGPTEFDYYELERRAQRIQDDAALEVMTPEERKRWRKVAHTRLVRRESSYPTVRPSEFAKREAR